MKKILVIVSISVILFLVVLSSNRQREYDITVNEKSIINYWEEIKGVLEYDKYCIMDIKSDGIEMIISILEDKVIIEEINLEIGAIKNNKLVLKSIYANENETVIKDIGKLDKFSPCKYGTTEVLEALSRMNYQEIMIDKMICLKCRLEYKGFIQKKDLKEKYINGKSNIYILDSSGELLIYEDFRKNYSDEIIFLSVLLNYVDENSSNQNNTGDYVEVYIVM